MKDKKIFGSFIKEKRIEKNLTQKQLAEILFVTESAVSKWERGIAYPDITLITEICKALDVSESELINASNDVNLMKIKKMANKYNRIKKTLFWFFNILYATTILTCFIVNLSVNHTLSWFFIVLTSILCAYSFCPTITWCFKKYSLLAFICSSFVSLFFLFLTCSIYTNNYWFLIPTIGVLLTYWIIFFPIVFTRQKKYLNDLKYLNFKRYFFLIYLSIGIILITLLLLSIHLYHAFDILLGISIVMLCFIVPLLYAILFALNIKRIIIKLTSIILLCIFSSFIIFGVFRAFYVKSTIENNSYLLKDTFTDIVIDSSNIDINIEISNQSKIEFETNHCYTINYEITNNCLTIKQFDNRKIFDMLFNFSKLKLNLYLTENEFSNLIINNETGNIYTKGTLCIKNINLTSSTGNTTIENVNANRLNIETTTGDLVINNSQITKDMSVKTSTGKVNLNNTNCNNLEITVSTGDITLNHCLASNNITIVGSTSDVRFNYIDALNINVTLSTGFCKGIILSDKTFIVKSDTGDIRVPETSTGGICKITTDTGDIEISLEK